MTMLDTHNKTQNLKGVLEDYLRRHVSPDSGVWSEYSSEDVVSPIDAFVGLYNHDTPFRDAFNLLGWEKFNTPGLTQKVLFKDSKRPLIFLRAGDNIEDGRTMLVIHDLAYYRPDSKALVYDIHRRQLKLSQG